MDRGTTELVPLSAVMQRLYTKYCLIHVANKIRPSSTIPCFVKKLTKERGW